MLHTTFELLYGANACTGGYRKLAKGLGSVEKYGRTTLIPISKIVETNNLADALWTLRCVLPEETADRNRIAKLFACFCAERVLPIFESQYPGDKRPRSAIETATRYLRREATKRELDTVDAAARAAEDAAWAARDAARAADAAVWVAEDAAWVAEDAAWAVRAAEIKWQTEKFLELLALG